MFMHAHKYNLFIILTIYHLSFTIYRAFQIFPVTEVQLNSEVLLFLDYIFGKQNNLLCVY